jgi:sterol 14-demethylase
LNTQVEDYPGAFASGDIDFTHISREEVLHSSIKEAIRMYPPLIFLMRRVVEPMAMPNGTYVPKGHRVIVSNAVAQMLPEIFPEPETYNPSRWTDFDMASFPKYSFVGFGAGIHTCMGESFAFMQIR